MDEYKKVCFCVLVLSLFSLTLHTLITISYDLKSIAINYLENCFFPTLYSREQSEKALQ
jgi:hypothetical protein